MEITLTKIDSGYRVTVTKNAPTTVDHSFDTLDAAVALIKQLEEEQAAQAAQTPA